MSKIPRPLAILLSKIAWQTKTRKQRLDWALDTFQAWERTVNLNDQRKPLLCGLSKVREDISRPKSDQ